MEEEGQETPISVVQPVFETPVEPKKKSIWPKVVILLILFLVLAAGSYKYLNKTKPCQTDALICPDGSSVGRVGPNCDFAPCPEISVFPTAAVDETDDWKTYTDFQYGYSVKYSPSLVPKTGISDIYLSFVGFGDPALPEKGFSISVRNTKLDKEVEYQKGTVEGHIMASLGKEENLVFQGHQGVRLEFKSDSEGVDPFAIVIINKGENSYAIKSNLEEINQILSTFKFLD